MIARSDLKCAIVAKRLNASDVTELRACNRRGYVTPRFNPQTGKMLATQWQSWQKLQFLGCGKIGGMGEAEDFVINEFGRQVLDEWRQIHEAANAKP